MILKLTMIKNKLFILVGPSGVGKNTLLSGVIEKIPNLKLFPSYTTRPIRTGEKEGREHFFVTNEQFQKLIDKNLLLEHEEVHPGLFYGVPCLAKIKSLLEKNNLIKDIDVLGAQSLKKAFPENLVIIFVKPPSIEELKNRILKRGELTQEQINARLARIPFEMEKITMADYQVINDKLEDCVNDTIKIIQKEIRD